MLIGNSALATKRILPDTVTRRMLLVQGGQEREIGTYRSEVAEVQHDGRTAFRIVTALNSPMLGTGADTVHIDAATFKPLRHRSVNARRTMALDYRGDSIIGSIAPAGGSAQNIAIKPDTALFDANSTDFIIRSLPLAEGYAARYPVYVNELGGATWVTSRVTGTESLTTSQGQTADVWVVETKVGPQTFRHYIDRKTYAVHQTVLVAAPGVEIKVVR